MSVSYATRLSAPAHPQSLPSFRDLLPSHLHDEIESTSYLTSLQHSPSRSPSDHKSRLSYPPSTTSSSSKSTYPSFPPTYPPTPPRPEGHPVTAPAPAPADPQPPPPPHYISPPPTSHRPSPVLPSIRDLQSSFDSPPPPAPPTTFAEPRRPRPEPYAHDYPPPAYLDYPPRAYAVPGGLAGGVDRRNPEHYVPAAAPHASYLHAQNSPYPYLGYTDLDASGRAIPPPHHHHHHHHHPANFGIISDATDPKSKRRRGNLPKPVTDILRAWFHDHLDHPYPSEEDKQMFMTRTGLSISQISNWFINARRRQLPALRNQLRSDGDGRRQSPSSDVDMTSQESISSPNRLDLYRSN